MKKATVSFLFLIAFCGFSMFTAYDNTKYFSKYAHETTWNGKPAIGLVSRDGREYSFYTKYETKIATLPTGEAVKLR